MVLNTLFSLWLCWLLIVIQLCPHNVCPSFRTPKCTSKGRPVLDKAKANAKLSLTHVLGKGHERKSGRPDTRVATRTIQSVVSRFMFERVLGAILSRSSRPG